MGAFTAWSIAGNIVVSTIAGAFSAEVFSVKHALQDLKEAETVRCCSRPVMIEQVGRGKDDPAINVMRISDAPGVNSDVNTAARFYVRAGAHSGFGEWAATGILDNYARAGDNVAFYGQANKHSRGAVTAAAFEAAEHTDAEYGAIGSIEADISVNGPDPLGVRYGINVVGARPNGVGPVGHAKTAFWANSLLSNLIFNSPFLATAAWDGALMKASNPNPLSVEQNASLDFFDLHQADGNDDAFHLSLRRAAKGSTASSVDLVLQRTIDGKSRQQIVFLGGGGVQIRPEGALLIDGDVTVKGGIKERGTPVSGLPVCKPDEQGRRAIVTDGKSSQFLAPIVGHGSLVVPALCNGKEWVEGSVNEKEEREKPGPKHKTASNVPTWSLFQTLKNGPRKATA